MKIIEKKTLADFPGTRITQFKILAPLVALKANAGQFVVVMAKKEGERIPLTIVDKDAETVTLIFQEAGFTTSLLGQLKEGDFLYALAGPLGNPTEIRRYGSVMLVGGGVGIAEIYPVAKALKRAGNSITCVAGAKSKGLLILEKELRETSDTLLISTDDGSAGKKGFTTDTVVELLGEKNYDLVYCVGPIPMMKKTSELTRKYGVKTFVSLNALMVDATGMCGCCRVTVGKETKFSCVDGPEFDAHQVDWDELGKRNAMYREKEKHICKIQ